MVEHAQATSIYGMAASFDDEAAIIAAANAVYANGYRHAEAYTPYPIEDLPACFHRPASWVPLIALCGTILGGVGAFATMYYASAISYPLNIGGKPLNSWPAFIPITFELAVLGAGTCAVFGMLALCRLPQPYHPLFNLPAFRRASRDRFFVCVEASDPKFDREATRALFESLRALSIFEVPKK